MISQKFAPRLTAVEPREPTREQQPWEHPVPHTLYKYFPPERLHVLTECKVRFTQRQVFEDEFEFAPPVARLGDEDDIRRFMEIDPVLQRHPPELREAAIRYILDDPALEKAQMEQVKSFLTAPDEYAAFCLTDSHSSERMWREYAGERQGFVLAFDTTRSQFKSLRQPGLLGKVQYSDKPISSFLSAYGPGAFFRRRTQYSFEAEWRSLRHIRRFEVRKPEAQPAIYLAPFDPGCIKEILIQTECAVEWELRHLAAIDMRYRHVAVRFTDQPTV